VIANQLQGKYTPLQVRDWLRLFSSDVREALEKVEDSRLAGADCVDSLKENREYQTSRIDFLMLADLADYHRWKILAAIELEFFHLTRDSAHLREAHTAAQKALEFWATLASRGEAYFHDDLNFSAGAGYARTGNWKERLPELEKDVHRLKGLMEAAGQSATKAEGADRGQESMPPDVNLPSFETNVPTVCTAGEDLMVDVVIGELPPLSKPFNLHYRHTNQLEGAFRVSPMEKTERGYRGVISGAYIVPEWDLMVYFAGMDGKGQPLLYPGLYHASHPAPYFTIAVVDSVKQSGGCP
jgi:hypothetical protein